MGDHQLYRAGGGRWPGYLTIQGTGIRDNEGLKIDNIRLYANRAETTFTEKEAPVLVLEQAPTLTDVDDAHLTKAVMRLTNPRAGDMLSIAGQSGENGTLASGISYVISTDANTGELLVTFTGRPSDPAAPKTSTAYLGGNPPAEFAAALASVQFSNSSDNPDLTQRVVEITVTDNGSNRAEAIRDPKFRHAPEIVPENSNTAIALINIIPVNDPPVAQDDTATTPVNTPVTVPVLENDTDVDGDPLKVTSATVDAAQGSVVINADGSLDFAPAPGFIGTARISYTISDGRGGSDTARVTVNVTPVNAPPVAQNDTATTPANIPVTVPVLENDTDVDGDPLKVTSATVDAAQGSVVINADGSLDFTPAPGFIGTARISYTISDGRGGSDTARVTVNVTPVNAPPVAQDDTATTPVNTPVTVLVLENDTDVDGDPLKVTSATVDAAQGSVVINVDGSLDFTPAPGFIGTARISYTISDGRGGFSTAAAFVTVAPKARPDAPAELKPVSGPVTQTELPIPVRQPFGSTGLHILYDGGSSFSGAAAGVYSLLQSAAWGDRYAAEADEGGKTPRALSPDTTLNLDDGLDQLLGTEIRQYIHDTVNHTWERVERWYGTGTPGTEMLRYDALGGAQDPFNGFSGPMDSKMLEELNRVLNSILDGEALTGGGESGLSPVLTESRTLQNQLSRADNLNRDIERLSRIFAEEK